MNKILPTQILREKFYTLKQIGIFSHIKFYQELIL